MLSAKYEKLGIPTVDITLNSMFSLSKKRAFSTQEAMPYLRIISIPSTNQEAKNELALATVPKIVEALTKPLTEQEKYKGKFELPKQPRIAFTGTLDEVQEFFLGDLSKYVETAPHAEYTDGLPVMPPTEDRVARMFEGTSHKPGEVLGQMAPAGGLATVEKVAINAVMAGARPEYMPVLLAVTEAMVKDPGAQHISQGGGGLVGHSLVVCGPVAKEIGINSGGPNGSGPGPLSPGVPANMVIGRFMRLLQRNIAGIEPGVSEAKWVGHPYKTSLIIAEDNEGSPWPQMSAELGLGFKDKESTVTLFVGWADLHAGVGPTRRDVGTTKAHVNYPNVMERYMTSVAKSSVYLSRPALGLTVLMSTGVAKELAKAGYGRKDIQKWIYEHAVLPWGEVKHFGWHGFYLFKKTGMRTMQGKYILYDKKDFVPKQPDDTLVRHFGMPEFITIVVGTGSPLPGGGMVLLNQHPAWTVSVDKWR